MLDYYEYILSEFLKYAGNSINFVYFAKCLLKALNSMHEKGMVHGNIRPICILLRETKTKGYEPLLMDFHIVSYFMSKFLRMVKMDTTCLQ